MFLDLYTFIGSAGTMLTIRRFPLTWNLVKRSLWTGTEPLSTSDPEMFELLKKERRRQVCAVSYVKVTAYDKVYFFHFCLSLSMF